MNTPEMVDDAKVMSKGQITIPKKIRKFLGIESGDRVTFVIKDGTVQVKNSTVYAMQMLQRQMQGQAEMAGFSSEEEIAEWITNSRRAENK